MVKNQNCGSLPILDSKLISPTLNNNKKYNIKLIDCGEYVQVYYYNNEKVKHSSKSNFEPFDDLNLENKMKVNKIITDLEKNNTSETSNNTELKEIELRNVIRSKLECQRIAKANMNDWKTFVTLTFSENITEVEKANKKFRYFIDKVRRVKEDFKYLCITEFQKRGAIHYHLLTNINIDDETLFVTQKDNPNFKDVKYWLDGFSSIEQLTNDPKKVIGYISKYMTKDIDNRLFSHHRYFCSQNLNKPKEIFINISNLDEQDFYKKIIQDKSLIYQNEYINPYDNSNVSYLEFQK